MHRTTGPKFSILVPSEMFLLFLLGLLGVPLVWRRHRIRVHQFADGTSVRRLWEEVQVGVFHLPGATGNVNKLQFGPGHEGKYVLLSIRR